MPSRRATLQQSLAVTGLLAASGPAPWFAWAFDRTASDARTLLDGLKAQGGPVPAPSAGVQLTAPEIAENGAAVPMGIASSLAGVRHLLLLVEKNPTPLVAKFDVSDAIEPAFMIRVKVGQSSDVYAVAITGDGKAHYARREVKVTLGGCG